MNDDTKALIGVGIRTNLVGLPSIPGLPNFAAMIAHGWSEYVNHQFQNRVGEFFAEIKARFESLEALQIGDLGRTLSLEAQIALLEETVAATSREPQTKKREAFLNFYLAAVFGKLGDEPDQVRSLLQTLEALTPSDIELLKSFSNGGGTCSGDELSGTTSSDEWEPIDGAPNADSIWSVMLNPILQKVTKLETRGLIVETRRKGPFQHSGDSGSWHNLFRRKSWRITETGCQLLDAVSANH
jgi:hypothetical protein